MLVEQVVGGRGVERALKLASGGEVTRLHYVVGTLPHAGSISYMVPAFFNTAQFCCVTP